MKHANTFVYSYQGPLGAPRRADGPKRRKHSRQTALRSPKGTSCSSGCSGVVSTKLAARHGEERTFSPWPLCSTQSTHSVHTGRAHTRGISLHRTTAWRRSPDRLGRRSPGPAPANSSGDASTHAGPLPPLQPSPSPSPRTATASSFSWISPVFPRLPQSPLPRISHDLTA